MKIFTVYKSDGTIMTYQSVENDFDADSCKFFVSEINDGQIVDRVDVSDPENPKLVFMEANTNV